MLIFEIFEGVPDPRTPDHAFKHLLIDVLCIALCAILSGAETFVDMEDYGVAKESWLRERLGLELPHGIPSHDTFNRLFSRLDPKAFEACFIAWTQHLQQITEGEILAIDGKSVRRSFDRQRDRARRFTFGVSVGCASAIGAGPTRGSTKKQRDDGGAFVVRDAGFERVHRDGGCTQQSKNHRRQSCGARW